MGDSEMSRKKLLHLNGNPLVVLQGDVLERLAELPSESVQMCVTSPPYWGLRDYGTGSWTGGDESCTHRIDDRLHSGGRAGNQYGAPPGGQQSKSVTYATVCGRCGAKRVDVQLGLEATPEEYVGKVVEIFREVRRVLRSDGTLWLNLGDSYGARGGDTHTGFNERWAGNGIEGKQTKTASNFAKSEIKTGLKPKDLVGIPWRVAFALQADGWWLRQDIIWAKPNPMPESVTDRCTKAHEYLFLLTKSSRYFYDAEAIKEVATPQDRTGIEFGYATPKHALLVGQSGVGGPRSTLNGPSGSNRNKRSVWTVATAPYPEAHFATYPPDLIKPCILAGTSIGGIVLDPFAGSGTTGAVALELGRKAILIELNPKYCELIEERCTTTLGLALA